MVYYTYEQQYSKPKLAELWGLDPFVYMDAQTCPFRARKPFAKHTVHDATPTTKEVRVLECDLAGSTCARVDGTIVQEVRRVEMAANGLGVVILQLAT